MKLKIEEKGRLFMMYMKKMMNADLFVYFWDNYPTAKQKQVYL